MAIKQKAIKVGSSVAAVLPKSIIEELGITAGTPITVEEVNGTLVIRPVTARSKQKQTASEDEQVAETALSLIKRYQGALKRLADA